MPLPRGGLGLAIICGPVRVMRFRAPQRRMTRDGGGPMCSAHVASQSVAVGVVQSSSSRRRLRRRVLAQHRRGQELLALVRTPPIASPAVWSRAELLARYCRSFTIPRTKVDVASAMVESPSCVASVCSAPVSCVVDASGAVTSQMNCPIILTCPLVTKVFNAPDVVVFSTSMSSTSYSSTDIIGSFLVLYVQPTVVNNPWASTFCVRTRHSG